MTGITFIVFARALARSNLNSLLRRWLAKTKSAVIPNSNAVIPCLTRNLPELIWRYRNKYGKTKTTPHLQANATPPQEVLVTKY